MANRNRPVRSALMILGLAVLLAACASDTSTPAGTPIALPAATTPSATTASPTSTPTGKVTITAPKGATLGGYAETQLTASADTPIQIAFRNDDPGIMHNVQLFEGAATTGTPLWAPAGNAAITGVDTTDYQLPPLVAGTYTFNCFFHPATMFGTLTVE
jgi:plastocyanin